MNDNIDNNIDENIGDNTKNVKDVKDGYDKSVKDKKYIIGEHLKVQ